MTEEQRYIEAEFHEVPEDTAQPARGDSFDIGSGASREMVPKDMFSEFISNPKGLANILNVTPKQAENIASILAGAGAGAGYKFLAKYIGGELASALGGFLGAHISGRILKK